MNVAAAATMTSSQYSDWAYLVIFFGVAAGWVGVPMIGAAVVSGASVLASQDKLEIVPVLVVSVIAGAVGGPLGYQVGQRWGRELLDRPGWREERRRKSLATAERIYLRWGRLAVFMTPSWMAGVARMRFSTFVLWNVFASIAFTLSTGPTAYGAGKASSGNSDTESLIYLIVGLAVAVGVLQLARRYRRTRGARRADRLLAGEPSGPTGGPSSPAGGPSSPAGAPGAPDAPDAPAVSGGDDDRGGSGPA